MSTPAVDYDALAAQHGGSVQVDYDALAAQHGGAVAAQSKHDFSTLTANPKGEGTYKITTNDGQTLSVPYSNVPVFTNGLAGTKFASPDEEARFQKDAEADPHRPTFWNALTNPVGSGGRDQGIVGGALQIGGQAVKTMAQPLLHPIDTAKGVAKVAGDAAIYGPAAAASEDVVAPEVDQYMRDKAAGGNALALENLAGQVAGTVEGGRVMGAAVSGVKPSPALGAAGEAPAAGAEGPVNTVGGANRLIPEAVRNGMLPSAWDFVSQRWNPKGVIAGDVNAPMAGTDLTPAARYESMKGVGVQPNAAEATGSPLLKGAENVNENSLTAAPTYARARAANIAALNRFTDRLLDTMSPQGPEAGGAAVQQGLRDAQTTLQNGAAEGFSELDRQTGGRMLQGQTIQQTAQNIYDANKAYYEAHPALIPGNAWKIVKDLAGADNNFQSRPMSFPEVHQLRSDLLEMVRTNPDIVKNQAGGWLQQLAGAADQTMTTGAGGLSPQGLQVFRDANEAWANMKGTYDNPSHPFYQAVRSASPSTLVNGISRTPEMAKSLVDALGPEGIGPIQRGVLEKVLGTTKEGGYNFKNFQGMWNKLPESYRDALFTPEQRTQLEDIGNAGTVLHEDVNPSGSAKLGQKMGEMGEGGTAIGAAATGHPLGLGLTGAYHAAQYALAKLMNAPTFVDWLMRDQGLPAVTRATGVSGRLIPAAVASGAMISDPHTGPAGQPNFYSDEYLRSKAAVDAAGSSDR
jgi:hypothetical protein